jgi:sarcosine oxidase
MFDVIVVGLGAMGSAAATHLARRGQHVLGLEAFDRGHALGSSHGESRVIRLAYFEHPDYVPLLRRAYELWHALEADTGQRLLVQTGGLFIGAQDSVLVRGTLESVRAHGLAHQVLGAEEIGRTHPLLRARDSDVAIYEDPAGLLLPERCLQAHMTQAERAGAELRFGEPVRDWFSDGSSASVVTTQGRYSAARLVITAGAWVGKIARVQLPLQPERVLMFWLQPKVPLETFAPERFPIWLWDVGDPGMFYGFPHLEWPGVKLARHHSGVACDPETLDRDIHASDEAPIRDFVSRYLPALDGPVAHARVCMYTNTPDEHFVVDRHPDFDNVVYAGGFSGHGFKFSTVIGEILADLSIDGRRVPEADFLAADRLAHARLAASGA